jgi:hypothetical protein
MKILFSENPEQDRQHHGNDKTRGKGKVNFQISRLEDKITRQPAQIEFVYQWPAKAKDNKNNANRNQCFCHIPPLLRQTAGNGNKLTLDNNRHHQLP